MKNSVDFTQKNIELTITVYIVETYIMYNECDKHQRVYAQGLFIPQLQNTTAQICSPLRPPADCPSLSQPTPSYPQMTWPGAKPLAPQPVNKCHITYMASVNLTVTSSWPTSKQHVYHSLPENVYRYQLLANSVDEATTKLTSQTSKTWTVPAPSMRRS